MTAVNTTNLWDRLTPDPQGLVTAVVQHAVTGQVLMVGHMNAVALEATLHNKRVTFWSRSRDCLWEKGESSGNTLHLRDIRIDCDADALLIAADPAGPTCHTGRPSCFFQSPQRPDDQGPPAVGDATLAAVFAIVLERKAGRGATNSEGRSYVRSLLDRGVPKINEKIREEAEELCEALTAESPERVASEAADLIFHTMVGLAHRGLDLNAVARVFASRLGTSGIDEKANRDP